MPPITSCTPQEPFIKLDPSGQASILDYNIPQETTFHANGYMKIGMNSTCFSASAMTAPFENFWDEASKLSASDIYQLLNDDIVAAAAAPTFVNPAFLHNMKLVRDLTPQVGESRPGSNARGPMIGGPRSGSNNGPMIGGPRPGETTLVHENGISDISGLSTNEIVNQIVKGRRPIITRNFYGSPVISFLNKPATPEPAIYLVFHYKIATFLGDYGAGKTLKTFSLLPGEKTTITVRTFRHTEENKTKSEHIFDSFSKSSADSLQSTVETEYASSNEKTKAKNFGGQFGSGLQAGLGDMIAANVSRDITASASTTTTIAKHMSAFTQAIDTHTTEANSAREVEVSTDVSSKTVDEIEETTVRQIQNINLSRTLNFVYRQMLQQYLTITYLDDVSIMFYNGYPESRIVVKLGEVDDLLNQVLTNGDDGTPCEDVIVKTRKAIYRELCNIFDFEGTKRSFMECVTQTNTDCCGGDDPSYTQTYARKVLGLSQTYDGRTVPGIILAVKERTLRTDSVVVDAVLGQGEALDCYNQHLQNIAVNKAQLENDILTQQLDVIENQADAATKADKYKKVFGSCCEVPQSCCGGGCGCNCPENPKP